VPDKGDTYSGLACAVIFQTLGKTGEYYCVKGTICAVQCRTGEKTSSCGTVNLQVEKPQYAGLSTDELTTFQADNSQFITP